MITAVERNHIKQQLSIPHVLLRLEGLTVFFGMIVLYGYFGYGWWTFTLGLLLPDIAMAAYAVNKRVGAFAYNLVHSYSLPAMLAIAGIAGDAPLALQVGLIWLAHIGMDRCVGYGLKYATDFKDTHLGRV